MAQPAPGDLVTFPDVEPDDLDPPRGTVIDHVPADMTPPDTGMVLIRWSRSSLRWEYADDLVVIAPAAGTPA